jgi:hypothetical protein
MPFLGSDILSDTSPKPQKELAFKRGKKESEHRHQQNKAKKTSTSSWILVLYPHAPLLHTAQSAREKTTTSCSSQKKSLLGSTRSVQSRVQSSSLSIWHSRAVVHIHHSLVE